MRFDESVEAHWILLTSGSPKTDPGSTSKVGKKMRSQVASYCSEKQQSCAGVPQGWLGISKVKDPR